MPRQVTKGQAPGAGVTAVPATRATSHVCAQVLRLKLGQVLSIRAFPTPCLKLSSMVPLGRTGMGLKVHFDVPLDSLHRFYQPPARLMLR